MFGGDDQEDVIEFQETLNEFDGALCSCRWMICWYIELLADSAV